MTDPKKAHEGSDKRKSAVTEIDNGGPAAKAAGDDIKKQGDKLKDEIK